MDDMVIAYHDCVLRVRDVALLTGPHWLNDAVMSFYFEYLREEENARCANLNASARDGQPRRRDVVFVDATVSFLVANVCATEAGSILEQTGVNRAKHVLFLVRTNYRVLFLFLSLLQLFRNHQTNLPVPSGQRQR
jgi:sentrin-specific protease 8|tara:strand:+ start:1868 stop:2275 length:408 start_codon:yes stop_codon:yes gene_type:complete